ncbi:MAG: hypothetical protein ACJAUR_001807 [Ulvibacter sp.]
MPAVLPKSVQSLPALILPAQSLPVLSLPKGRSIKAAYSSTQRKGIVEVFSA